VRSAYDNLVFTWLVLVAALCLPAPAFAQARPTLSGRWTATAMNERYSVGDWGPKCGPKPSSQGAPGGSVTIVQSGSELTISGAGRSYSTTNCWEQAPGLRRVSHSASPRGWSNRCTTADNDPRRATVVTTMSATDTAISFDETGTYQFVLEDQNCTASVRRTRSYSLVQREGEAPPPSPSAPDTAAAPPAPTPTPTPPAATTAATPPPAPTKEPAPPPACDSPGEPARLEVRPARKLMRPGEEFTFQARVLDAKGCRLEARPTWAVAPGATKLAVDPGGTVKVPADATEGTADVLASLAGRQIKVTVEVASIAHYEALLAARGLNARGETDEAAVAVIATGSLGGGAAVAENKAQTRKIVFVAIVSSLAVGLAVAGFVLLRRGAKRKPAADDDDLAAPVPRPAAAAPTPDPNRPRQRMGVLESGGVAASTPMTCPVCKKAFPPGSLFCPEDGTRLVQASAAFDAQRAAVGGICPTCGRGFEPSVKTCPEHGELLVPAPLYNATSAKRPASEPKGKICPTCGSRYGGEAGFCGKDGTALVLVN
jgi:hypothetical protein